MKFSPGDLVRWDNGYVNEPDQKYNYFLIVSENKSKSSDECKVFNSYCFYFDCNPNKYSILGNFYYHGKGEDRKIEILNKGKGEKK